MTTPSWGSSIPFMFDLRDGATYLVCVECFTFQRDISTDTVETARYFAEQHIEETHNAA